MAVKLSDLTTESAPASTDILLIADPTTGAAKKISVSALKTYMDGLGGGGDVTAPVIVSATASTASTITIVFSESVTVTAAGWSFKKNGSAWAISSVSGSGNTWTFTMASSGTSSDTILRSYDSATGATVDTSANELASFTDSSVTNSIPGTSYDTDAEAFFTAAGITSTGQKDAINTFVLALKSASIWTKMAAVYPFVGGTSTTHKFNLKNPADTDAAYRLLFSGSWTHDANGITGDGATAWADTFYGAAAMNQDSVHMSLYSRTSTSTSGYTMGTGGSSGGAATIVLEPRFTGDLLVAGVNQSFSDRDITTANTDGGGFYGVSRTASGSWFSQKGATSQVFANASIGESTDTIALGRLNEFDGAYSPRNIAFASIGGALTESEMDSLNTAVVAYETALGRNV